MDNRKVSHDILNILERLRIMHDLVKDKNFSSISQAEIEADLKESLVQLEKDFQVLLKDS